MANILPLPRDLRQAGWTLEAYEQLRAAVPAAQPLMVWHLALDIAAIRSAEGEACGQREHRAYERFLRRLAG